MQFVWKRIAPWHTDDRNSPRVVLRGVLRGGVCGFLCRGALASLLLHGLIHFKSSPLIRVEVFPKWSEEGSGVGWEQVEGVMVWYQGLIRIPIWKV